MIESCPGSLTIRKAVSQMTDLDRAERTLAHAGMPLHVTDLAAQMHAQEGAEQRQATLDAMLSAKINMAIRVSGSRSPFVRVGPSVFAHRSSCPTDEERVRPVAPADLPFSSSAASAISQAREEAASMNHDRVAAGHLFAGVASLDVGIAAQVLLDIGVDRDTLIHLVREAMQNEGAGEHDGAG